MRRTVKAARLLALAGITYKGLEIPLSGYLILNCKLYLIECLLSFYIHVHNTLFKHGKKHPVLHVTF